MDHSKDTWTCVCSCDWNIYPWKCPALLPFPGENCIYHYYGFILTMNLFLWMHFRAWGWLLLWFHEVLMVMDGADSGGGTHTWICWNSQLLLALRSSCARSSWNKGNSRQRKCGRGLQVFISGRINQPYLCRSTRAFTSMDFQQRPSSHWNGMKQLLGMWFKVTSGVPGGHNASSRWYSLPGILLCTEQSILQQTPTHYSVIPWNAFEAWISNFFKLAMSKIIFIKQEKPCIFTKVQTWNFLCGLFFFPFLVQNCWSFFVYFGGSGFKLAWLENMPKKRKQIESWEMELGRHKNCKEEQFQ